MAALRSVALLPTHDGEAAMDGAPGSVAFTPTRAELGWGTRVWGAFRCGRFGAGFFFGLDVVEPLGVGHGGAGGDHADPGAVGGLGEVDGDAQAAGEGGEAGDVVLMLVGDEDGVEGGGIFVGELHALEQLAAGEAGVDEQAGVGGGDDRGVALGAGGENGHAHSFKIRRWGVDWGFEGSRYRFEVRGGI